jgi:hypothetical protein
MVPAVEHTAKGFGGAVTVNVFAALSVQFPPTGVILVVPAVSVAIFVAEMLAMLVLELV